MQENDLDIQDKLLTIFRNLSRERQQQVSDFVDFLIWQEERRNAKFFDSSIDSEM